MLVDTSVWSLLLHRKKSTNHPAIVLLTQGIQEEDSIAISGLIYQEILQGVRNEIQRQKLKLYLKDFDFLETNSVIHDEASRIFILCRSKGVSAHTIDCLIAAVAIHYRRALLTTDADFTLIARYTDLKVMKF